MGGPQLAIRTHMIERAPCPLSRRRRTGFMRSRQNVQRLCNRFVRYKCARSGGRSVCGDKPAQHAAPASKMSASKYVVASLFLLSLLCAATAQACDGRGVITRKSVKSMTEQEWDNYVDAHRRLRATSSGQLLFNQMMNLYERFTQIHSVNARHNQPLFVVWHRLMLWEWDKALNRVKPGVVQPYFDWSVSASSIFSDAAFGATRYGGSVRIDGSLAVGALSFASMPRSTAARPRANDLVLCVLSPSLPRLPFRTVTSLVCGLSSEARPPGLATWSPETSTRGLPCTPAR
jgi:Common central domain of tyrosinase